MAAKLTAVYVRVSSKSQDVASQEPDLKRWAEGQAGPVRWYRDQFTGRTMERPGFSKLMADVQAGKVGTLAVWRLDRLGRTAKGLTTLFDDLAGRKVNLVSLRDGLDLATPAGRLMANVLASVAAYETEVRAERVIAGLAVARDRGVKLGRPPGPGKPVKTTPEQRELIARLRSEKTPIAQIARATGLSRPTVYSVLRGVECPQCPTD